MFCLTKPGHAAILDFLSTQKTKRFSYAELGCTRQSPPQNFIADHNRILLGHGFETFERSKSAIRQWKMFEIPWLQLCWPSAPMEEGTTVALLVSHLGFWSLNACRIVYLIDESAPIQKFGFAYGTLPDHVALGEERFTVEFNPADRSVTYDLYALSRPTLLARLAYPFTRSLQKRFAQDSKSAMQKSVASL